MTPNQRKAATSSAFVEWETPQEFFNQWDAVYHFETDVCASVFNAKCATFFSPEQNGLAQQWRGRCWMNPPYGRKISLWIKKAYESAQAGAVVVCLLPARTDTKWWHDYCMKGDITFLRGRLRFSNADRALFPSAVVVFK